ncbi:MAG: ester cyclase [Crocosphaera sp.]
MSQTDLEANKTVVRRWVEQVFNGKNMAAVDQLKTANYVDWTPFPGQGPVLEGFKPVLQLFLSAFPDFQYVIEDEIAEGDLVVFRGRWKGTHNNDFLGLSATGREITGQRIDTFRVVGDKMVEHWGCGNELNVMQLLGILPVSESTSDS